MTKLSATVGIVTSVLFHVLMFSIVDDDEVELTDAI